MNSIFEGLNAAQKQAVENIQGASLVIAGAGSGKTRVLTCRIANLLAHNVPSHTILALTFTNKAAREMKERIAHIVGEDASKNLWMGTFHSIFSKILRFESASLGFSSNYTIYDTQDSRNLIGKIISELKLDKEAYKPASVAAAISKAKNNLITAEAYAQNIDFVKRDSFNKMPDIHKIYTQYHIRCKKADAMDFDDLLLYTNILFRDHPIVLEKYQKKFQYILVDEYQDTNFSQYVIVKKLALPQNNVCVVGDDAQSIYSFRGAKIENILKFGKDYPHYRLFKLEQNYRSTQTIVNAANSIIKKNKNQIPKNTFSGQDIGSSLTLIEYVTDFEEGIGVAKEIQLLVDTNNCRYQDIAILYRTNAQSRILEEALNKLRIPCKIFGGTAFFQRKEIKDILSYVRVCVNPKDEEAITRIINYPMRGIGQTTVDKIRFLALKANCTVWEVILNIEHAHELLNKGTINKIQNFRTMILEFQNDLPHTDAYSLMNRIIEKTGIYQELKADSSLEGKGRFDNMQELLNGVKDFVEQEEENIALTDYLEKIALLTDIDIENDAHNKVTLMTVHSAKGLEFEHCFLVGLEENLFPSQMSMNSEKSIEEERRLFYVALTRAKKSAYLTFALSRRKWGNHTSSVMSRFVKDIDSSYIQQKQGNSLDSFSRAKSQFSNFSRKKMADSQNQATIGLRNFKKTTQKKPIILNFEADNPQDIREKTWVLHAKFGKGFVQTITGEFPESTAVIDFENEGQKRLLLKFAKLKQIEL
ncbi:MAG TPA: 3'-5' exonuclease [Bacteroidales bacterium]|nr:3'-5' exonuclease [Bacteroidales bacterium]